MTNMSLQSLDEIQAKDLAELAAIQDRQKKMIEFCHKIEVRQDTARGCRTKKLASRQRTFANTNAPRPPTPAARACRGKA